MDPISRQKLNQVFTELRAGQLKGVAAEPQDKTHFKSKFDRWGSRVVITLDRSSKLGKVLGYTGVILGMLTLTLPLYLAIKGKFTRYVDPVRQNGNREGAFLSQVSKSQWKSLSRFSKGEQDTHKDPAKDRILRSNAMKLISNRKEAQELQPLLKQCTTRQLCQLARGIAKEDNVKVDEPVAAPGESSPVAQEAEGEASAKAVVSDRAKKVDSAVPEYRFTWSPAVFEQLREVQRGIKSPLLDEPILKTFDNYETLRAQAQERIKFEGGLQPGLVAGAAPESAIQGAPDLKGPLPAQDLRGIRALAAELMLPANLARASAMLQAGDKASAAVRQVLFEHKDALALVCARPDGAEDARMPAGLADALRQALNLPGPLQAEPPPTAAQWQDHLQQVTSAIESLSAGQAQGLGQALSEVADKFDFAPYSERLQAIDTGLDGPVGGFFEEVFKNYFSQQPPEDRRAMVASLLRQSTPADSADLQLAALLKGAGPFMHKTLQLFCDRIEVESTKIALSSVKTGLTPIDTELKTAMLNRIVQDSAGKIEALRGVRTLGAASVGEALLADVKEPPGADGQAVSRRVVIKLLRPGIVERAARERAFFAEAASHHAGMGQTFAGIAEQIEAEMNLQSEARNVQRGQVYNGQAKDLQAMELSDLAPAQADYMVVKQAPGSALQQYIDLCEKAARGENVPESFNALEFGRKAAQQVAELGRVWMAQAIAGNGFFHGDLHAGNLMFQGDSGLLTAIDFGNAAAIEPGQQEIAIRLGLTLEQGHPRLFEKQFRRLLGPSAESLAWASKEALTQAIRAIMRNGNLGGGEKLAEILNEYTSLGIEVPAFISNFSRSMMMLEETLGRLNQANYINHLRSNPATAALLKRRDEFDMQRHGPVTQATRDKVTQEIRRIDARIDAFEAPEPVSMSDAFGQALGPHVGKLAWRAGLGFTARTLRGGVKELTSEKDLKIAQIKDAIKALEYQISDWKGAPNVQGLLVKQRNTLQSELNELQAPESQKGAA